VDGLDVGHQLQRLRGGDLAHAPAESGERAIDNLRVVAESARPVRTRVVAWVA
jgi:hypothetical protein